MKVSTPTSDQTDFDPAAKRYSCGDVSPSAASLLRAGSQEKYREKFEATLVACGVTVIKCVKLHDEFQFVVDDNKAASDYEKTVTKVWSFAKFDKDKRSWFLPYLSGVDPGTLQLIMGWLYERGIEVTSAAVVFVGLGFIFYDTMVDLF